jgi:hypothetical protein
MPEQPAIASAFLITILLFATDGKLYHVNIAGFRRAPRLSPNLGYYVIPPLRHTSLRHITLSVALIRYRYAIHNLANILFLRCRLRRLMAAAE